MGNSEQRRDRQHLSFSRQHVNDQALRSVVRNLAPAAVMVLPFVVLAWWLMRDEVRATTALTWVALTITCSISIAGSVVVFKRCQPPTPAWIVWLLRVAFALMGAVFGFATIVGGTSSADITMLFTLFPATGSAIVAVLTAGRRDMCFSFLLPTAGITWFGLFSYGDDRLAALAIVWLLYAATLPVVHHLASTSLLEAIRLQAHTEVLLAQASTDRSELGVVNQQLEETNRKLAHQASHDPLTSLLNRRGTLEKLDEFLINYPRVGVLFCDLDRFKAVNDAIGHRGGDQFIQILADRISRSIEPSACAGRIGGDEFVVLLPGLDVAESAATASRIVGVMAQPVHVEGRELPSSISVGVAGAPVHGKTSSDLLKHANAALYRAKAAGRNRVEVFDGMMQREIAQRLAQEQDLRRALDQGEILPFFQPEIDATDGQVVGAELLARWVRPDGTVLAASEFITVARNAGLAERVTEVVVAGARLHMRRLAMLGLPTGFRFRINVGLDSMDRAWREHSIDHLLNGLDPTFITVDVHESAVSRDLPAAAARLAAFRANGGRVCLDDFARGVSSLSTLRRLPLDEVRIDRLSIDTITSHPHDRAIIRSVIALVRELGLAVTADGVETGPQADALIALGCVRHQGHLYAPALIASEFEDYLLRTLANRYNEEAQRTSWDQNRLN